MTTERRVQAALAVLAGADVHVVASDLDLEPEIVMRWVELFCEGGELRLSERAQVEPDVKDRFLTLVAHEFRTPLAIIGGWVETLLTNELPDSVRENGLEIVRRQVEHLERVARDALDAGAVARGQLRLVVGNVDLRDLVQRVISSLRDAHMKIVPGEPVPIVADGSRLEQVIGGVVEHARRLAENTDVEIEISTSNEKATVTFSVRGRALAIGEAAALLEPYTRSDTSFGTGLGLYLCRALLVAHEGDIGLRSEGDITVFWFRLPLTGPKLGPLVQHQ